MTLQRLCNCDEYSSSDTLARCAAKRDGKHKPFTCKECGDELILSGNLCTQCAGDPAPDDCLQVNPGGDAP